MKRTTIFKTIALAAAMMLGSEAWGQTTLYHRALTTDDGATEWSASDVTAWGSVTIDATNGLGITRTTKGTSTASYSLGELDGTAIMTYDFKWYVYAYYSNDYYDKLQIGNNIFFKVYGGGNITVTANGIETAGVASGKVDNVAVLDVHCVVNTVTKTITEFTIYNGETSKFTLSSLTNEQKQLNTSSTFNGLTLEVNCGGGSREQQSRLRSVKVQQTTQDLTKYGYTLIYCTDPSNVASTTVKTVDMTAAENKVYNGTRIDAESPFTVSTTKYYATDDATTSFNITSDNQECLVKVRKAYSVDWELHGQSGETDLGTISSGTTIEGENVSQHYRKFLLKDGVLYKKDASSNSFACSFTITEGSSEKQTHYVTGYSAQDGYAVYCEEAENITGMTAASTTKSFRASGNKVAYCNSDVTITTLPAGKYKVYVGLQGDATSTFTIKAGESTVWTETGINYSFRGEKSSDEFTVTSPTAIKINGGSSSVGFDNIYIMQTGVYISAVDNLGYTFSSTLPLDFNGKNVEAYTGAYNSTTKKLELSRVYKVPANTGLFIKGTADDIPVLTGDADAMGTNNLIAVSATTKVNQIDGANTNFVLGVDNASAPTAAVFLKAPSEGVSVGAGKAYLQIPTASVPAAARMAVVFNDETTGISHIENGALRMDNSVYNLRGQRVAQPKKGLYIVNGKKVMVK